MNGTMSLQAVQQKAAQMALSFLGSTGLDLRFGFASPFKLNLKNLETDTPP